MKIVIEVPNSELPQSIQELINKRVRHNEEDRSIVYACLIHATKEFYRSKCTIDEYRLELL